MSFTEFIGLVLEALHAADVTYLIGGAVAVWAWGEPRTTADLDLVIDLPFESIVALSQELEKRDIASIVLNLDQDLDYGYIDSWTGVLGVVDSWQEIQNRIAEMRDSRP